MENALHVRFWNTIEILNKILQVVSQSCSKFVTKLHKELKLKRSKS